MRTVWKILQVTLMFLAISYFLVFGFSMYFWPSIPSAPHPEQGRLYALNNHAAYTYMNRREYLLHEASLYVLLACGGAAVLIENFVDPFNRKSRPRPPWISQR
jgi:hypothetical protein